jgi:type IV secretory pathway TrbF-like protein
MTHAVARALGIDLSPAETMPLRYQAALSAWRRHVVDTRRHTKAWRYAAVASMALCVGLAGALSLALIHPAIALHVAESGSMTRVSAHATSVPFEGATVTSAPTLPKWLWQGAAAHD